MVAVSDNARLGAGVYTPREAALFAKLRTQTFNRWFYGNESGEPVLTPRFGSNERVVAFWDLMQAVAVRTLRNSPKASRLSLQHVRRVVNECDSRGVSYPLARRHTLFWYSNRLILKTDEDIYIGLDPTIDKDQLYHGLIIEPFLQEVQFGTDDRLAYKWTPLSHGDFSVTLDSRRRFGMPVIEENGILVSALVDAVESEGSIEGAADAFEVDVEAVLLALKYKEYLSSAV